MEIDFIKMNGCGNDFVMIDNWERDLHLNADTVRHLCDRHFGIGADGVILVEKPLHEGCDGFMNYINADGTYAQMCGNGVRCFAKYLLDQGLAARSNIEAADALAPLSPASAKLIAGTRAGEKPLECFIDASGEVFEVTVNMGSPILDPALIPVSSSFDSTAENGRQYVGNLSLVSPWGTFAFCCVSFGNPHAVAFFDTWEGLSDKAFIDPADKRLETLNVDMVGEFFESHHLFPEKANIEFAVVEEDGIHMRVFERGCRETLACGTGACATLVAAALKQLSPHENDVVLSGGRLHIEWKPDASVDMTGPAVVNYRGVVEIPD